MSDEQLSAQKLGVTLKDGNRSFSVNIPAFTLQRGECVALVGESGSGKTLAMEMLGVLRPTDSGQYDLNQSGQSYGLDTLWTSVQGKGALQDVRSTLFGYVPQTGGLIPYLTTYENITLPQQITGRRNTDWIEQLIDTLGLDSVRKLRPDRLSIGQRQRVSIARALSHMPPFLLADEPTSALDPSVSEDVLGLLLNVAQTSGIGIILSSHDHRLLERFGVEMLVMHSERSEDGRETVSIMSERDRGAL